MKPRPAFVALLGGFLSLAPLLRADSPAAPAAPRYARLARDRDGTPTALETAVARFAAPSGGGVTVDLVGVVHVADGDYYRRLNERLAGYDVVLYELVAPPGTRIPKGGKRDSGNPLALVMQVMKAVLDLDLQVERIDYTRPNFVHADLSPEQMAETIRARGDDGLTLFLGVAADLIRQQNVAEQKRAQSPPEEEAESDPLGLLLDPDGPARLKRLMAEQMEIFLAPDGGLGPTLGRILIADRNQAALRVLQKEIAKGRKKVAIFYGAAHMPDFERRLREDFGLKRQSEEWLTAWDLKKERGLDGLLRLLEP